MAIASIERSGKSRTWRCRLGCAIRLLNPVAAAVGIGWWHSRCSRAVAQGREDPSTCRGDKANWNVEFQFDFSPRVSGTKRTGSMRVFVVDPSGAFAINMSS